MSSTHAFSREPFQGPEAVPLPPPKPVAGESFKQSETTRLLCAAAYLERTFRDLVIKFCLDGRHRALGACFGLDMPTVVRHCRRAKRILGRRALFLSPLAIVALIALLGSSSDLEVASPNLSGLIGLLVLVYLISFAICLYFESRARAIVTQNFLRGNYKPDALLKGDSTPVSYLQEAETGNTVIYSGFTPFVGSGENVGAWSFALDLRKRAGDGAVSMQSGTNRPANLSASELDLVTLEALYARVAGDIAELNLDRVTVQDKLYVNGRDIRDDNRLLSDPLGRPRYQVTEQVMTSAMLEQAEKQLRHYRCIRVVDWSGELVLSIFLRFSKLSHNLFVEASYFLLTPVAERFRAVDSMSPHFKLGRFINLLLVTAIKTPFLTLWAPFELLGRISARIRRWSARREEDELIRENPTFDYGAAFSFRQWASSNEYRRYFQRLDKEMYLKVLEKNILDSILTFLEENDVDVSELKQRQTTILNHGVILSGGNMTTQNLSVGVGAKVENVAQKFAAKAAVPTNQPVST
jgi:hypothetical protein